MEEERTDALEVAAQEDEEIKTKKEAAGGIGYLRFSNKLKSIRILTEKYLLFIAPDVLGLDVGYILGSPAFQFPFQFPECPQKIYKQPSLISK